MSLQNINSLVTPNSSFYGLGFGSDQLSDILQSHPISVYYCLLCIIMSSWKGQTDKETQIQLVKVCLLADTYTGSIYSYIQVLSGSCFLVLYFQLSLPHNSA